MTKAMPIKLFCPSFCYILLLTQTTIFYYKNQIDNLNQSNLTINNQLKTNANTGSITINSANQTNIIANQNQASNQYTYNASSFSGTTKNQEDLNIAETISPLLSSNNITINSGLLRNISTPEQNNINLLSSILTGQGNLTLNATNGNINMQSLQDQYYYYSKHELTNLDIGALIAEILAAIIIGAFTAGAGAAFVAGVQAASIGANLALAMVIGVSEGLTLGAVVTGGVVAAVGIGIGMGVDSAIDHENGGAGATKDMKTGFSDSTTKEYKGLVGNSLLFGGSVNLNNGVGGSSGSANIDQATNISSSSLNQTSNNNESALFQQSHKVVAPDWSALMTNAAIVGVISGVTVAGTKPFLEFADRTTGLKWLFTADEWMKGTILNIGGIYPGAIFLTRTGLETGASEIVKSNDKNN